MADTSTVKLHWLPPLGPTYMAMSSICSLCDDFFSVSQFATSSNSSHPGGRSYYYKPSEAEGNNKEFFTFDRVDMWIY